MAARRWIATKAMRYCPNHDTPRKVTLVDSDKGLFSCHCKKCSEDEEYQANSYKEKRPCARCKDVVDFTVKLWGDRVKEHSREFCSICELETSAAHHYQIAKNFMARVAKLRAERAAKKTPQARESQKGDAQ